MTEAQLQRACVKALTLALGNGARGFVIEQNAVRSKRVKRGPEPGIPDLQVLIGHGRVLFIELKLPGEELRESQVKWHERAFALGHWVYVCRSVDDCVDTVRMLCK